MVTQEQSLLSNISVEFCNVKFERRIARVPVVEEAERGGLLPAKRLHGRAGRPHLEQEVIQNEWI